MARRLKAMRAPRYRRGFKLTLQPTALAAPMSWKSPRKVFVNSMSDLFHKNVPDIYIQQVFDVMTRCPQHQFQILTKRSNRLRAMSSAGLLTWPSNVWMGVSVEDQRRVRRATDLAMVPAAVRFLSVEPLLGPIENLPLDGIHWVIVGGESGPGARHMEPDWVDGVLDQCRRAAVPFFFKQWGGVQKHRTGRLLAGRTWDEMPLHAGGSNSQVVAA
jgi:protein gp37